jgi:hypothetical protein
MSADFKIAVFTYVIDLFPVAHRHQMNGEVDIESKQDELREEHRDEKPIGSVQVSELGIAL